MLNLEKRDKNTKDDGVSEQGLYLGQGKELVNIKTHCGTEQMVNYT